MDEDNYTLNERGRRLPRFRLELTGSVMKIYGCVTMLCYTVSRSVVQLGLIDVAGYGPGELSAAMEADPRLMYLSGWASVLQLIGGLALPVFAFLLVEGFMHTASVKKYLLTMLVFALVSEAPYDLAMSGVWWDMTSQNALYTYAVCLVMLYGLRLAGGAGEKKGFARRLCQGCIVLAAVLWSMLLQSAFGMITVLLAAVYYLWYDQKGVRTLLGCAVSILYVTAPLSGYVIYNYSGRRGRIAEKYKYVFYALYPAHLLILGLISRAL